MTQIIRRFSDIGRAAASAATGAQVFLGAIRRIAGMPDYRAHLAHLRAHHPGAPVPSEREYFERHLRARYDGGPTRCC